MTRLAEVMGSAKRYDSDDQYVNNLSISPDHKLYLDEATYADQPEAASLRKKLAEINDNIIV